MFYIYYFKLHSYFITLPNYIHKSIQQKQLAKTHLTETDSYLLILNFLIIKDLAISIYFVRLVSTRSNIITMVVSRYSANEISKCFV